MEGERERERGGGEKAREGERGDTRERRKGVGSYPLSSVRRGRRIRRGGSAARTQQVYI